MTLWTRIAATARRHPRLWGLALATVLAAAYLLAIRPARVALAVEVAGPLYERIDTERGQQFEILASPRGGADVYAVPPAAQSVDDLEAGVAVWASPFGALFIVPALFLALLFPDKPYWLYLLAYHAAVGLLGSLVFAIGLGWVEPAFALYTFSRTYLTETVSLVVPLLLWLAGRAEGQAESAVVTSAS